MIRIGVRYRYQWRAERITEYLWKKGIGYEMKMLWNVPPDEVGDFYRSIDVFLNPSDYDSWGYTILEAQLLGIPVITFKGAKIPEETNRFTIKAEDEQEAAYYIENFKQIDTGPAKEYAKTFTVQKMARETAAIYREI